MKTDDEKCKRLNAWVKKKNSPRLRNVVLTLTRGLSYNTAHRWLRGKINSWLGLNLLSHPPWQIFSQSSQLTDGYGASNKWPSNDRAVSCTTSLKRGHVIPPDLGVINRYKPFWKSASSDITCGRVHLDVLLDRSVYQPSQWTIADVAHQSVTHLGGHAH